jgi:glycine oxidase
MHDVIIVGGGVIGLAIARQLATDKSVLLLDRGAPGAGASWAAAGILSPLSEADDAGPFFNLCAESFAKYAGFAADLHAETGRAFGFSDHGVLSLASSTESFELLQRRREWQRQAGFAVELLSPEDIRQLEPLITLDLHGAVFMPKEGSVSPRQLVNALRESCFERGVEIRTGVHVNALAKLEAGAVIVASGVWSGQLEGLDPPIPVVPRKGQILSLGMPASAFRHTIRWQHSYFVPRQAGELVLGATEEDEGFDRAVTAAGVGQLLREGLEMSLHIGPYPILETWTGLRPGTPDRLPIIGASALPHVFYATGHYRNGILLAPITASIIADLVEGRRPAVDVEPYSPFRFL